MSKKRPQPGARPLRPNASKRSNGPLQLYEDAIAEIAARLDLRDPNRVAVQSLAAEVSQHYDVDEEPPPFEAVIDSATGVGKTYILTGAMELFAAVYGVRDFTVVTPGRTILGKTMDNFTPGHRNSLLGPMSFRPVVITSDNFATPAMRSAMDDDTQVKLYLFTVQSLIRPESRNARRAHQFQEGLGTEFYAHLQAIENLVVFADEHHCYYGPAFSKAVRDLGPWVLVGLTATPDKKTPEEQIIFRYPLAAAIADQLVKTPVIVGRRDDRTDPLTKLTDGVMLLRAKSDALTAYATTHRSEVVHPVMLVVAKSIDDANEYGSILRSSEFFGGAFADAVLVVHSNVPEEALEELEKVEKPDSPVRIIISVGMLKEGWDVANVYVIVSMRASVSEILTEQTLGRGMRLPFGSYTGIEILDTLEVVAHERYQDLLKRAGVLNEAFIDYRTRAALRINAESKQVVVSETVSAGSMPVSPSDTEVVHSVAYGSPLSFVTSIQDRTMQAQDAAAMLKLVIKARTDVPTIRVPLLRMSALRSDFSLADITDVNAFHKLGKEVAANPDVELNRTLIGARIVIGFDGIKRTELVRSDAADHIRSIPSLFSLDELRMKLADMVLSAPFVPARKEERSALRPLLDAFFDGLGSRADEVLSANLDRAAARLLQLVAEEQRRFMAPVSYQEVVKIEDFASVRSTDKKSTPDRFGPFSKSLAYEGWSRSLFSVEWFDSSPERDVANMLDRDGGVVCWVKLHVGELPILWNSSEEKYNPDFIVIEEDGTHLVVEVKMDKEMRSPDVQGKREAATRWANHVSASPELGATWRYLLAAESDVSTAKGSWSALKTLAG